MYLPGVQRGGLINKPWHFLKYSFIIPNNHDSKIRALTFLSVWDSKTLTSLSLRWCSCIKLSISITMIVRVNDNRDQPKEILWLGGCKIPHLSVLQLPFPSPPWSLLGPRAYPCHQWELRWSPKSMFLSKLKTISTIIRWQEIYRKWLLRSMKTSWRYTYSVYGFSVNMGS